MESAFTAEVDAAITAATEQGLGLVLSMHHADGLMTGEPGAVDWLGALWHEVAARYRHAPTELAYDLLNEPRGSITPERWNELLPVVLGVVRDIDPTRMVIVGGAEMSTVTGLLALEPPADDHLLVTMHYYEPFAFTHQAAPWQPGSAAWAGTRWGSSADRLRVSRDLETAASWAAARGLALYVGEFGTYHAADAGDRTAWTSWVRVELERLNLPWAYWDFRTDFGVYDAQRKRWRHHLLDALISEPWKR